MLAEKPFFLFKSNSNELIEDICWNRDGNFLMASTMKKYMFVALFEKDLFGRALNEEEKNLYLKGTYGGVKTISSEKMNIDIFRFKKKE